MGLLKLIDDLKMERIAKLAKALQQGEIIEGAYTDGWDEV